MSFAVCEDLVDAGDTKIHNVTCGHFRNHKPNASTMEWHGPFDDYETARATAARIAGSKSHGFRDAGCCMRRSIGTTAEPDNISSKRSGNEPESLPRSNVTTADHIGESCKWQIDGQPIAWGSGQPEKEWRAAILDQSPPCNKADLDRLGGSRAATLKFFVAEHQVVGMPDLDNLMVPVMEEARNVGWFSRGFPTLDDLTLSKNHAKGVLGVGVGIRQAISKADRHYQVSMPGRIREGDADSSLMVEDAVRSYMLSHRLDVLPTGRAVRLAICYQQRRPTSVFSMIKSTIDGLEPLLGRPDTANPRSRFFPADERVVEIAAIRMRDEEDRVSLGWSLLT
ncbi:MAG: hypothetical protein KDB14_12120 [Planctomycetales bacterium]|nr:hypothetical protein [Planctomycetales bacterium]